MKGQDAAGSWVTIVGTTAALTELQRRQAMAKRAVVTVTGDDWRGADDGGVSDHFVKG